MLPDEKFCPRKAHNCQIVDLCFGDFHAGAGCQCPAAPRRYRAFSRWYAASKKFPARFAHKRSGLAGACRVFRKDFCQNEQAPTPEAAQLGGTIFPGSERTHSGGVLHVQRPRFSLRRPIFSKGRRLHSLRQRSVGAAAGPAPNRRSSWRCAAQSRGSDGFLASIQLFHHQRHESQSRLAGTERHLANSLCFPRPRQQIDQRRDIRFAQRGRIISTKPSWQRRNSRSPDRLRRQSLPPETDALLLHDRYFRWRNRVDARLS